ncbi:hypothetical protein B0J12DRAFT_720707 [Macrophomina phaseolina]|uniref:Rhodopsin domain-containing protein n=1 Tax=Macrophomina phaseolina TaxID=35725 RepID=A0ABQ8G1N1_9PEZI|nr:hypothetical protein B0J12DRAFT_720707 [Macrophomina phaseolina]
MSVVDDFVAEAWALWGIATLTVSLRLWARLDLVGWRKLDWDDPLMVLAHLFYTAETVAAYYVAAAWKGLANNGMTEAQRAALNPNSDEWRLRVNGSKTHIIGWIVYTALFWLLKARWLIYYMRLTGGLQTMRWRIRIGWAFLGTTYIAALFMVIFKCLPISKQWQIYPGPGNNCEPGNAHLMFIFVMAINTATDLYLMTIPLPMIYKSRIELKRKITLLVLFSGGFLVISFGILRCITLVTVIFSPSHINAAFHVGPLESSKSGPWSIRESFMAVFVSNFPMIFPLFKHWYHCARDQSTKKSSSLGRSYPLGSNPQSRSKNSRCLHPLSLPSDTAWNSQEAIIVSENGGTHEQQAVQINSTESLETDRSTTDQGRVRTAAQLDDKQDHQGNNSQGGGAQGNGFPASSSRPSNVQITVQQEYSVEAMQRREGEGYAHCTYVGYHGNQ